MRLARNFTKIRIACDSANNIKFYFMTIKQIYDLAIQLGIKNDLRGVKNVEKNLERIRKNYTRLTEEKRAEFDADKLTNPYSDSQILNDTGKKIKKVFAGIDMDSAELIMAKGMGDIDLVISHHPSGKGLANLADVMSLQVEVLAGYGVPINVAEGCFKMRIDEVSRGISPINHYQSVDAAKLLNLGYMCTHTVCDNMVANFLKKQITKKKFSTVGEVVDFLKTIPEYAEALKRGAGPRLFAGSEESFCGRICLSEITGGTEGSPKIYKYLSQAGVGTIVGMHMSERHKKEAEKNHLNVIIAGHISSDSIGMNLFLDELEKRGVEVITGSGLIRVKR